PHLLHPVATNNWWETRLWVAHTQTKSLPTLTIINKHCLMHRCLLEPRFVKWSKPRQAPWGLILVWHWHMLRLSPVSTLQPFLLQTRSDRCRLSRHQVCGFLSMKNVSQTSWTHKITPPKGWQLFVIYRKIMPAIPVPPVIIKAPSALPIMECTTTLKITSKESIALRDATK